MQEQRLIDDVDRKIVLMIADLGNASEVEIQARTLQSLRELRSEIQKLERLGILRRRHQAFKGGYGDALELTELGYRTIRWTPRPDAHDRHGLVSLPHGRLPSFSESRSRSRS